MKLIFLLVLTFILGACTNPFAPKNDTCGLVLDTLGWMTRSPSDTVGPITGLYCSKKIKVNILY